MDYTCLTCYEKKEMDKMFNKIQCKDCQEIFKAREQFICSLKYQMFNQSF